MKGKRTVYEIKREMQNYNEQLQKLYSENVELALANDSEGITRNKKDIDTITTSLEVLKAELERREKESIKIPVKEDNPIENKGVMYRSLIKGEPVPEEIRRSLFGTSSIPDTGGSNFIPTNLGEELIFEKFKNNPIRDIATTTNIVGLELPRVSCAIDNMDFVKDGETAKEISLKGEKVKFGSFNFRLTTEVADSLLEGTNTNLVKYIEKALKEGLAKKEKYSIFKTTTPIEKHMNIYSDTNNVKKIQGETLFKGIKKALSDLSDEYYHNATIVMRKNEYFDMMEELSNNNTNFYDKQSQSILGINVVFCEEAEKPIVGDFSYLHINYDMNLKLEPERQPREGRNFFVLSGSFDIQYVLTSPFRIVEVTSSMLSSKSKKAEEN